MPNCLITYAITISKGSIIILGFQMTVISLYREVLPDKHIIDFLGAFIILFLFIPIIKISERYFPYLMSFYRSKDQQLMQTK